jgi:hypothetical protein
MAVLTPTPDPPQKNIPGEDLPKEFLTREIVVPETLKDPHLLNTQAIGILQEPIIDRNGIIMTPQGLCS